MQKIGLIAPEWSLERFVSAAREYKNEIELIPFRFDSLEDIPRILDKNRAVVGKWLFSGPIPFYIAKKYLNSDEDLFYCRITESGLLKTLLEVAYRYNSFQENISLDFIKEAADVDEMLKGLEIPTSGIQLLTYSIPVDEEKIFRFHYDLWKGEETRCAITTLPSIYARLEQNGIPVFKVRSSMMEMRITFELLIEKNRSQFFKNSQLGILIIEICDYENVVAGVKTPYDLQFLELKVYNALLTYAQRTSAYLVQKGNGRYEIFGSRGNIERSIGFLRDEVGKITLELNVPLIAGGGFGETVFLAQINANKALHHARNKKGLIVFTGDGGIVEYRGDSDELSYNFFTNDEGLNKRLRKSKVGVRTYKKMRVVASRIGAQQFTASTIASQMGVTDRNIRRIISGLLSAGLLLAVGEESSGVSGRPAKLYRFPDESPKKE